MKFPYAKPFLGMYLFRKGYSVEAEFFFFNENPRKVLSLNIKDKNDNGLHMSIPCDLVDKIYGILQEALD